MNNLIITFQTGVTEITIDNFDTNKNAITGIIIKGIVKNGTVLSFSRQSNDIENDTNFYVYTDYEGAAITLPIYSNVWMGVNPWSDLLSIINSKGKLKLMLNQTQDNNITMELLFLINAL